MFFKKNLLTDKESMKSKILRHLIILIFGCFLSCSISVRGAEKQIKQEEASYALAALSHQASFFFNSETELYTCVTCGKEREKKSHIKSHLYVHIIGKHYQCDHVDTNGSRCTKRTKRPDGITRHKNEKHTNSRPHECHQCQRGFKRKEHLKAHLNAHQTFKKEPNTNKLEETEKESPLEEAAPATATEEEHEQEALKLPHLPKKHSPFFFHHLQNPLIIYL